MKKIRFLLFAIFILLAMLCGCDETKYDVASVSEPELISDDFSFSADADFNNTVSSRENETQTEPNTLETKVTSSQASSSEENLYSDEKYISDESNTDYEYVNEGMPLDEFPN